MPTRADAEALHKLAAAFPGAVWCAATMLRGGRDARRLAAVADMAQQAGVPLLATNDALFDEPTKRPLHDVMTAIREHVTVQAAGRKLARHAERHLKPAAEMTRLFAAAPHAVAETQRFFAGIHFSLDQLRYEYPREPVPPGYDAQGWLEELVRTRAAARWPEGISEALQKLLDEELPLIERMGYAPYFLTVHDIVAFAQGRGILCQGRGSAANSAVCYVLGITAVDPAKYNLLFSRFISEERREPPDIDVDFEHERREEVIQYIYERYGRERAGIAATVIHYRPRSAVREVGKALGLSEDVTARLASTIWGSFSGTLDEKRFAESGFDPANPEIARVNALVQQLLMFPRHLSQHVGGFVLTEGRLDELVPIHNAAMPDRTFIEWDKDDIDALGLMKVDVLALGMLTCIRKAFDMIEESGGPRYSLDSVPDHAPDVYAMLQKGDSIGVFQVESRAQMNMLPRMKPACFYDLAIQVAIVRPGPIQGDMVHPYLRRRQGREAVSFPSPDPAHGPPDELQQVLGKTLGVPLFQEQAMKLAIVAAKFTPSEANRLRRSMATFRRVGGMHAFWDKLVGGMVARGYEAEFADRCFRQIEGFGSYGFPESHAIAFARLVWVSSYLKCRYPAHFAAALLNAQPMGFYAPAQIVRDANEHGVEVAGVDVNESGWDNRISSPSCGWGGKLRLGLRQIDGFREAWARAIETARASGPFTRIEDLVRRTGLPPAALHLLADADAFTSLGLDRRQALWEARRTPARQLDLFAAMDAPELADEPDAALPAMTLGEHVVTDYQLLRLSLRAHPLALLRPRLTAEGIKSCAATSASRNGARVRTAGVVLVRQRPGNGKAIFITIEDESGVTNVVLWERAFERYRRAVMTARLMLVEGEVQVSPEGIVHLMASRIIDRSELLTTLSSIDRLDLPPARADEVARPQYPRGDHGSMPAPTGRHPRDVRVLPKSRDFH
jgi:error-prone DNA polymerase